MGSHQRPFRGGTLLPTREWETKQVLAVQPPSMRERLAKFQPGLAAVGIDLQIQSLLDNVSVPRSFSGRRLSSRALLAAYGRRLQALRSALPVLTSVIQRVLHVHPSR